MAPDPQARTQKATIECARWLQACLAFGWSKDKLDWLEALWWKHHDEQGHLKEAVTHD